MVNAASTGVIASMTGYAAREGGDGAELSWSWELRAVNARGLDLRFRLPDGLGALDAPLRRVVSAALTRGSVSLSLRIGREAGAGDGRIDPKRLDQALAEVLRIEEAALAMGLALRPASPAEIMGLRGLLDVGEAGIPEPEKLLADIAPLLAAFTAMRQAEGAALAAILHEQLTRIAALVDQAAQLANARALPQAERMRMAAQSLLASTDLDEARLLQEIATLALKTDVTEEIDRLRAHVAAARGLLAQGGAIGRKLDFLMQEFNREANTLCSKSQDHALTSVGLDLKLAIDQTREQVQNVE
ncbi:YicC/YloC family endoribonuclease [Roseicyclus sp.]|uniref:YicC/YloC family endoribonuclease n=1 Tax=Roseicyclus sp. TaxID=1914329 RepID=UPI003F6BEF83